MIQVSGICTYDEDCGEGIFVISFLHEGNFEAEIE
jgi:hypothetical protein